MISTTAMTVFTEDGVPLSIQCFGAVNGPPVVLSHGAFSNRSTCKGLAIYLARVGFTCWLFDWRAHGDSGPGHAVSTFETIAQYDVPCIIDTVLAQSGREQLFWLGHSGGGLVLPMWMARNPERARQCIAGVVLLATQACYAAKGCRPSGLLRLFDWLLFFAKKANGPFLGLGPESEDAAMMRQWCGWNLRRAFRGSDGFDLAASLAGLRFPVLGLAGAGDTLISPPTGCLRFAQLIGGGKADFMACGKGTGFLEDYTHHRLIRSGNAESEIWPIVGDWLQARLADSERLRAFVLAD